MLKTRPGSSGFNGITLPTLWILFASSGAAALVYEVVWFQLLQLIIGSSAVSLGVLLGTFMGGMCLGSYYLPRLTPRTAHPLRTYALLEAGIGIFALLLLYAAPAINDGYARFGATSLAVRAVVAALCLLPPTMMMGATLPAIARWVETTPRGVAWLGYFYGGNIAGAMIGTLTAALYLLRFHDVAIGTYAAAAVNFAVAAAAWALARRATSAVMVEPAATTTSRSLSPGDSRIYWTIALSGLTALSAQVVWTRLLSLLFGGTVYTFALILAVFLAGLGVGSTAGAVFARRTAHPARALGWAQLLVGAALLWSGYLLMARLPFVAVDVAAMSDPVYKYGLDLWRAAQVVLPGAILWGASFPLALAALARPGEDPARLVGAAYAANTLGAIAGSIGIGLLLVARLGSQHTQQVLVGVSALSGLLMLLPRRDRNSDRAARKPAGTSTRIRGLAAVVVVVLVVGLALLPPVPGVLVAFGRFASMWVGRTEITYVGEGLNAFVAVSKTATGVPAYHNSGKVQASSEGEDMSLQRMLGHFSHLVSKTPKDVLVIGLGAGITAGAVTIAPSVERVTIVEIEPLVPHAVAAYFGDYNDHVVSDPKVTVEIDDGRHYLLTTDRTFDVITSDPLDPWIKGAATLFTEELFQSMRRHLKPGGVVTQFVQLYGSNSDAVRSEIGTFMKVFPETLVFGNLFEGQGYDLVLVGLTEPMRIDVDDIETRLRTPPYARVAASLRDIGITSALDLFAAFAGSSRDLAPWVAGAAINTDRNLRLQYLAGLTLNEHQSRSIYSDMLQHTRFPDHVFAGSSGTLQELRARIERRIGATR